MAVQTRTAHVYAVVPIDNKFAVSRDDTVLQTPRGTDLTLPTRVLAESIAEEWRAQKEKLQPSSMPMMQLAATTIDITCPNREAAIEQTANYASSDLLCFHAENPEELTFRQQKNWQPILNWCASRFDALLNVRQGIMPITQPPEALQALRRAVEAYDDFQLTGLKQATEVTGSLVLALALIEQQLSAEQVFHAAELDSHFQAERWGEDPASIKRHESILNDLIACDRWLELLK